MLRDGSAHDQANAVYAIVRLVEYHDANKKAVVDAGGIALLVRSLSSNEAIRRKAATALGALVNDNSLYKLQLYQAGALAPLVELLRNGSDSDKSQVATTLGCLAKNNEAYAIEMASLGALELLVDRLKASTNRKDEEGAATALYALYHFSIPAHNQGTLMKLGIRDVLAAVDERLGKDAQARVGHLRQILKLTETSAQGGEAKSQSAQARGAESQTLGTHVQQKVRQHTTEKKADGQGHARCKSSLDKPPKELCQIM